MSHLEFTKVVSVHCNIANNDYQQDSRAMHTSILNKSFRKLLDISPNHFIFLKTFSSEFSYIEVWFSDLNYRQMEIEDKTNITVLIT